MAIDTAEKRKAAARIARKWSGVGVTNNATHDQEWRQEAGRGYPGILAAGAAATTRIRRLLVHMGL